MQKFKLLTVELEYFANESNRVCLFQVMKVDEIISDKVKLSTAEQTSLWTCFKCEHLLT